MSYNEIRIEKSKIKPEGQDLSKGSGKAGVYVWGFYNNNAFHPLYVGKSTNLFERLIQHYCRLRGGEYRMLDINSMLNGIPGAKDEIYEPSCFNTSMINYPKTTTIFDLQTLLENFVFRYKELCQEEDRRDGEIYLTNEIAVKLGATKKKYKDVLLSGKTGENSKKFTCQLELAKMLEGIKPVE